MKIDFEPTESERQRLFEFERTADCDHRGCKKVRDDSLSDRTLVSETRVCGCCGEIYDIRLRYEEPR